MKSKLEKAIEIAKRTGDKIIVVNEKDDSAIVLMDLDEYEILADNDFEDYLGEDDIQSLTEEELLDKINRDIGVWQENKKDKEIEDLEGDFASVNIDDDEEEMEEAEDDNMYYYDESENLKPVEQIPEEPVSKQEKPKKKIDDNNWQISKEIKHRAEDIQ
ncbi:hypothetical protein GF382_02670 [Candidatus Falkowbacteria bacterium]|nr:hypothetical protein [Candidatus Falkowbacteria bacterium]